MDKIHNLHQFFNIWRDETVFQKLGRPKTKDYPNLRKLIDHYELVLESTPVQLDTTDEKSECYRHTIDFWDVGYYNLIWDIQKAQEFALRSTLPLYRFVAQEIAERIITKEINWQYAKQVSRQTHPILIAHIPFLLEKYLVIDGTHTIAQLSRLNPQDYLFGYVFEPDIHFSFLAGDIFRVLYKIHSNIYHITGYMCGYAQSVQLYPV